MMWPRAKSTSFVGFERLWSWTGAAQTNATKASSSKAFWPTTLDKECDKAARILRSFSKDGFLEPESPQLNGELFENGRDTPDSDVDPGTTGRRLSHRVSYKRIPTSVIQSAKALVIFTTMRTGLWVSGAGGSGVIVARMPDGTWSPPSAIILHTEGVGFLVGVDLYDCVMVVNTREALMSLCKPRCTVGPDVEAVIGPLGVAGMLQEDVVQVDFHVPVFTYLKSKGSFARVKLDGTIVEERTDENDRFYGRRITVNEILTGRVSKPPAETNRLLQTIKAAQGDSDVDPSMVPVESSPSDVDLATGKTFGVPNRNDPDPYGFLALEKEGFIVREAGTLKHPSRESFQFLPGPSSPLFSSFNRESVDAAASRRSSWRTTITEKSSRSVDMSNHTDEPPQSPMRPPSALQSVMNIADVDGDVQDDYFPHRSSSVGLGVSEYVANGHISNPQIVIDSHPPELPKRPQIIESSPELPKQPESMESPPDVPKHAQSVKNSSSEPPKRPATPTLVVSDPSTVDKDAEFNLPTPTPPQLKATDPVSVSAKPAQTENSDADDEDDDDYVSSDEEEVVFSEVIIQAASPQPVTRARLVTVAKPLPPALPIRNPNRITRISKPPTAVETSKDPSWPLEEGRNLSRNSSDYSLHQKNAQSSIEPSLGSASSMDAVETTHSALYSILKDPSQPIGVAISPDQTTFPVSHSPALAIDGDDKKNTST